MENRGITVVVAFDHEHDGDTFVIYSEKQNEKIAERISEWYSCVRGLDCCVDTFGEFTDDQLKESQYWALVCYWDEEELRIHDILPERTSTKEIEKSWQEMRRTILEDFEPTDNTLAFDVHPSRTSTVFPVSTEEEEDEWIAENSINIPSDLTFELGKLDIDYFTRILEFDIEDVKSSLEKFGLYLNNEHEITMYE
jgi:hypothetical protein